MPFPLHTAQDMLAMLVKIDQEFDAAQDALCAAKRALGRNRINPLPDNHPTVLGKRKAVANRQAALAAAEDFLKGEPT